MADEEYLRETLSEIAGLTADAAHLAPAAFWVGDKADERRAYNDFKSGRIAFREANRAARLGVEALDAGEIEAGGEFLAIAKDWLLKAYAAQMEPANLKNLTTSAKAGGRTKMQDRNLRLVDAVEAQEALGLRGGSAIAAAFKAVPPLAKEFEGKGIAAIRRALREGKKHVTKT